MTRRELLRRIGMIEVLLEDPQQSFIEGCGIQVPDLGNGTIIKQDSYITVVEFNGEQVSFDATEIEESFVEPVSVKDIQAELKRLNDELYNGDAPEELIKKLISKWSFWDKNEEYYLNTLAYEIRQFPNIKVMPEEQLILERLKGALSAKDWDRLPQYISDVYQGKEPLMTGNDDSRIKSELKKEARQSLVNEKIQRTQRIIEAILKERERTRLRKVAEEIIDVFLEEDYLNARENYLACGFRDIIPCEDFEKRCETFVLNWFKSRQVAGEYLPDREQLKAISTMNKNVEVIARAGSGKTSTIMNRVRFLVGHCGVDPQSILLLAFNRKAVAEMRERIEKMYKDNEMSAELPYIKTFHSFAYSISRPDEIIFDDEEAEDEEKEMSQAIQRITLDMIRDPRYVNRIKWLMLSFFRGVWENLEQEGYYLSKEDQLQLRRFSEKRTINGVLVDTFEEKVIADILYEHGIRWRNISGNCIFLKPIEKKEIWLRYDNVPESGCMQTHYEYGREVKQYPIGNDAFSGGRKGLEAFLKGIFDSESIRFVKLSEEEIWDRLQKTAINRFTSAMRTFVNRCRKKNLSCMDLYEMIQKHVCIIDTEKQFLDLALIVYKRYLDYLKEKRKVDFDGLLHQAAICVEKGQTVFSGSGDLKKLRHILIDEYQDFSYLFDNLITAVREKTPGASLFCVGDDWQAINAFAGSELIYFSCFKERYEDSRVYKLLTNYRSSPEIVELSNRVMEKWDPEKQIDAFRTSPGVVKIGYRGDFSPVKEEIQQYRIQDKKILCLLRMIKYALSHGKRVVLLTRIRDMQEFCQKEVFARLTKSEQKMVRCGLEKEKREPQELSFTTHKYKGREQDVVILVDAVMGRYPLIHPAWIFQRIFDDELRDNSGHSRSVLGDLEKGTGLSEFHMDDITLRKIIQDELRLFYVAITRAKTELYILAEEGGRL